MLIELSILIICEQNLLLRVKCASPAKSTSIEHQKIEENKEKLCPGLLRQLVQFWAHTVRTERYVFKWSQTQQPHPHHLGTFKTVALAWTASFYILYYKRDLH